MGLASDYTALIALVVAMGLGVAAYHPEAYKAATSVAGERKATALSCSRSAATSASRWARR